MKYQQLILELVIRRHALGMTQLELATKMGLTAPQHIGRLEGMQAVAKMPTLEAWSMALGLNLHFDLKVRQSIGRPRTQVPKGNEP